MTTEREIGVIEESLRKDGILTLVDLPQAAAILRVSKATVRLYRDDGRLQSVYPAGSGQQVVFLRREIARFLAGSGAAAR